MTEDNISDIHLSLIRTFSYDIQDIPKKGPFNFLTDKKKYYELLMTHDRLLSERNTFVHGIGKLRSVLDLRDGTVADPFFTLFKEYYRRLGDIKGKNKVRIAPWIRRPSSFQLVITPHYPCVIDVFPSKNRKYKMITSTLPGSLQTATDVPMSLSMRIYPAGIASLRLGWHFSTENSFNVNDIVDFLRNKSAQVEIKARAINDMPKPRYKKLTIDKLTKYYARKLKWGLLDKETSQPSWEFSHSIIHIVNSDPISIEKNYHDTFLPLLCQEKRPEEKERLILNLGRHRNEVYLPGSKSFVIYTPDIEIWERKKIRRWLRNIIEFFSIQKYLIREIQTIKIKDVFDELKRRNVLNELRNGLLPPNINNLFSIWNYLNLKYERYPMKGRWRQRYDEILKIWDKNDEIKNTKEQTFTLIEKTVNEAADASKKLGQVLGTIIDNIDKVGNIIPKSS